MSHSALVPVQFHGASLFVTTINGAPHVAMRQICEAIGLQWEGQLQRIKRHAVLSTCVCVTHMQMPGDDQSREVVMLPLDKLNGWLFGVSVNRVRPELREKLTQYQAECFDVLAQHFGAVQPPVAAPAPPKRNVIRCKVESVAVTMRLTSGGVGFGIRLQGDHYNMHRFTPGEYIELEYAPGATPLADLPIGVNRIS